LETNQTVQGVPVHQLTLPRDNGPFSAKQFMPF